MGDYSTKELMACWLSRDLEDGEKVGVGANFHVPRAAVLLAHLSHCPNMKMGMGSFMANLMNVDRVMTPRYLTDFRPVQWAESALYMPLDLMGFHTLDVFFISGIQVDAYGNTNLIGIPGEGRKFKFRGPGSIGTSTLASVAGRYYIVTDHHTPRVFVERCSIISFLAAGPLALIELASECFADEPRGTRCGGRAGRRRSGGVRAALPAAARAPAPAVHIRRLLRNRPSPYPRGWPGHGSDLDVSENRNSPRWRLQ